MTLFLARPLTGLAVATAMLLAAGPDRAAAQTLDGFQQTMSTLLGGFGLVPQEAPAIDYRERPPLVVPPRSTLPSPQPRGSERASNWPSDPDVDSRRRAGLPEDPMNDRRRMNFGPSQRLSPDELARGRVASHSVGRPVEDWVGDTLWTPQRQMREQDAIYARRQQAEAERPVGAEPPRRFLIEPPAGLRAATQRVPVTREARQDVGDRNMGQWEFATQRR
jgi:hypothetical protein